MSNAIQIRDASDLTTLKKRLLTGKNYLILYGKNQMPKGGIPASDLMNFGFVRTPAIPTASILANVVGPADCPTCFNDVEYFTTSVIPPVCDPNCQSPYTPKTYEEFRATGP
jgi:hypothetical protein